MTPKASKFEIEITEGDESPVAKEKLNPPSAFLNTVDKHPLSSVHQIEVENFTLVQRKPKKHGSVRALRQATIKSQNLILQKEQKKLIKRISRMQDLMI